MTVSMTFIFITNIGLWAWVHGLWAWVYGFNTNLWRLWNVMDGGRLWRFHQNVTGL